MARVRVPGSSANLGPGFDAIGLAVELYNEFELTEAETGLEIEVEGDGSGQIPCGPENLAYRAAKRVFDLTGRHPGGLRMRIQNDVPLTRGLGSSAAAIVGGMVAANELAGSPLSREDVLDLATAMEGHPDNIAPALLGGVIVAVVEGGRVYYHRFLPPGDLTLVLAIPDFQVETKAARGIIPRTVPLEDAVHNLGHASLLIAALMAGRWDLLRVATHDRLHQPYRTRLVPGMIQAFHDALEAGADGVALSGSGPTLLAFAHKDPGQVGSAMAGAFSAAGVSCRIITSPVAAAGAEVLSPAALTAVNR